MYLQSRKTGRYINMSASGFYSWVMLKKWATVFTDRQEINKKCNHIYNEVVNGLDIIE